MNTVASIQQLLAVWAHAAPSPQGALIASCPPVGFDLLPETRSNVKVAIYVRRRDRTWVIGRVQHKYDRMLVSVERTQAVCLSCPIRAMRSLRGAKLVIGYFLQSCEIPRAMVFHLSTIKDDTDVTGNCVRPDALHVPTFRSDEVAASAKLVMIQH